MTTPFTKSILFGWNVSLATVLLGISGHIALAQSPLARTIDQKAPALEKKLVEWRRDFHQNPELGNREFKTAEKVANHLKQLGIDVQTGVAHTGVVGMLKGGKPGPVVALRADMDGLPVTERGICHLSRR